MQRSDESKSYRGRLRRQLHVAGGFMEHKKRLTTMKQLTIKVAFSAHYIEDGIQTVAFANSKDPEPSEYLILQRAVPEDEDEYYFEVNSREISGEGGFEKAVLEPLKLEIGFSKKLQRRVDCSGLTIQFDQATREDDVLIDALESIFRRSDCSWIRI
jgi:hypothetical protein